MPTGIYKAIMLSVGYLSNCLLLIAEPLFSVQISAYSIGAPQISWTGRKIAYQKHYRPWQVPLPSPVFRWYWTLQGLSFLTKMSFDIRTIHVPSNKNVLWYYDILVRAVPYKTLELGMTVSLKIFKGGTWGW